MKKPNDKQRGRWCKICNTFHGSLYICDHYPKRLKAKLHKDFKKMQNNFLDKKWVIEQLDRGIDPMALAIMGMFFGVKVVIDK